MSAVRCVQCAATADVAPGDVNRWYETHTCDPADLARMPAPKPDGRRSPRARDQRTKTTWLMWPASTGKMTWLMWPEPTGE